MKSNITSYFKAPFASLSTGRALMIAFVSAIALGGISYLTGFHNDGVIDMHLYHFSLTTSLWIPFAAWSATALLIWVISCFVRKSAVRLIDAIAYTGVARLPLLIAALGGLLMQDQNNAAQLMSGEVSPSLFVGLAITVLAVVAEIWLLLCVVKLLTNKSGFMPVLGTLVVIFVGSILAFWVKVRTAQIAPSAKETVSQEERQATADIPQQHEEIIDAVITALKQGNMASLEERLSPELKEQLPVEKLQAVADEMQRYFGSITKADTPTLNKQEGEYSVYATQLTLERAPAPLTLTTTINTQGLLSGIFLK